MSRAGHSAAPEGVVSLYGGSHGTFTPSIAYGGSAGDTQYFFSGRGNWNSLRNRDPTPAYNAIHDDTEQGKFFGYLSTLIDSSTRFSLMSGASYTPSKFLTIRDKRLLAITP